MNYAMGVGTNNGFIPLADADPFGPYHLKYARAVAEPVQRDQRKPLTKLGFSIFDELVPAELLDHLDV
jgi:hypothetical protein